MEKNILRIVRLSFKSEHISDFMDIFYKSQPLIEAFEGCFSVKLRTDVSRPNVFYTVSVWKNEEALENYRHSELFATTWAKTKVLFDDKPQAYSLADLPD